MNKTGIFIFILFVLALSQTSASDSILRFSSEIYTDQDFEKYKGSAGRIYETPKTYGDSSNNYKRAVNEEIEKEGRKARKEVEDLIKKKKEEDKNLVLDRLKSRIKEP